MDRRLILQAFQNGQRVRVRLADTDQWFPATGAMLHEEGTMSFAALVAGEVVIFPLCPLDEVEIGELKTVESVDGCAHDHCDGIAGGCHCACHFSLSRSN